MSELVELFIPLVAILGLYQRELGPWDFIFISAQNEKWNGMARWLWWQPHKEILPWAPCLSYSKENRGAQKANNSVFHSQLVLWSRGQVSSSFSKTALVGLCGLDRSSNTDRILCRKCWKSTWKLKSLLLALFIVFIIVSFDHSCLGKTV